MMGDQFVWNRDAFIRFCAAVEAVEHYGPHHVFAFEMHPRGKFDFRRSLAPCDATYTQWTVEAGKQKIADLSESFSLPELPAQPYDEGYEGQ